MLPGSERTPRLICRWKINLQHYHVTGQSNRRKDRATGLRSEFNRNRKVVEATFVTRPATITLQRKVDVHIVTMLVLLATPADIIVGKSPTDRKLNPSLSHVLENRVRG